MKPHCDLAVRFRNHTDHTDHWGGQRTNQKPDWALYWPSFIRETSRGHLRLIGRTISRSDLRLVVQSVVAICDWSYNQSQRSAIGRTVSRSDLRLVVQSVVTICGLVVRLPMTSLAINLWDRTTICTTSRKSSRSVWPQWQVVEKLGD